MADKKLIDNASATTVDNFYGNKGGADVQIPLDTAASVLADRFSMGSVQDNIDGYYDFGFRRVRGTTASGDLPFGDWFILLSFPTQAGTCVQLAINSSASVLKMRVYWDRVWSSWKTFTGA